MNEVIFYSSKKKNFLLSFLTLFKKTPYLTLNEQGLLVYKCPFIEWSNVKNIYFKKVKSETFFCVQPYDASKLINIEKLICSTKKLNLETCQATFGTVVVISVDHLSVKQKDLLDLINKFKINWANKYLKN